MPDRLKPQQQTAHRQSIARTPKASAPPVAIGANEVRSAGDMLKAQHTLGNRAVTQLQRQPIQSGKLAAPISDTINRSRGGGQLLPDRVRGSMESAFQSDFGGVRVHTDQSADTLNRSVQAKAFTLGSDIYFSKGNYQPGNSSGQELLAHELTHVVQQGSAHRATPTIQRKANQFVTKGMDDTPPLKQEILKQYALQPDGEFENLWSGSYLNNINEQQAKGGRPYNSESLLSTTEGDDRGKNPASVTVHASIGNLEAAMRGNKQAEAFTVQKQRSKAIKANKETSVTKGPLSPESQALGAKQANTEGPKVNKQVAPKIKSIEPAYDGGHLVAYQFLGRDANVYDNVAPQGKALNNGPFQNWEKKVLAAAIDQTALTLQSAGVPKEDLPHTFRYRVHVSYPAGVYSVSPDLLAKFGLIPSSDVDKFKGPIQLVKRVPDAWYATAQPLAFPSREELKAKHRPDAPFVLAPTTDFGIIDKTNKARTNQEYVARGPEALVKTFASKTKAESPADAFVLKIATNATRSGFVTLINWAIQQAPNLQHVAAWASQPWHPVKITIPKIKEAGKHPLKKYEGEQPVLNSNWRDVRGNNQDYAPDELIELATKVGTLEETEANDKLLATYLNDHNALNGLLKGFSEAAKSPQSTKSEKPAEKRPATSDTSINFSTMMDLTENKNLLPNNVRFQFAAKDTQPD